MLDPRLKEQEARNFENWWQFFEVMEGFDQEFS